MKLTLIFAGTHREAVDAAKLHNLRHNEWIYVDGEPQLRKRERDAYNLIFCDLFFMHPDYQNIALALKYWDQTSKKETN